MGKEACPRNVNFFPLPRSENARRNLCKTGREGGGQERRGKYDTSGFSLFLSRHVREGGGYEHPSEVLNGESERGRLYNFWRSKDMMDGSRSGEKKVIF